MRVVSTNHSAILISQLLLLLDEPTSIFSFQIPSLSTLSLCRRCDGSVHQSDGCGCWNLHRYKRSTSSRRRHRTLYLSSSNEYNNNDIVPIKKRSKRKISYSKSKSHTNETNTRRTISTMSTALCIVPPDDAWDTIQRARHLARDTSFYKWPPAIRLFHPFAPKSEIPSLVGMLADWIDDQNDDEMGCVDDIDVIYGDNQDDIIGRSELQDLIDRSTQKIMTTKEKDDTTQQQPSNSNSNEILSTFEITLDSILILPHFEILDARISALDNSHYIPKQAHLRDSIEETEYQKRKEQGLALIEEEERKGLVRKKERERKKRLKMLKKKKNDGKKKTESEMILSAEEEDGDESSSSDEATTSSNKENSNSYNGPCVIYLSPNDESRIKLETLRERLRRDLFSNYDGFSPSSSVSPYPECLPRKVKVGGKDQATDTTEASQFRPLLPVARFPTVQDAIKIAKILQKTWDPLTFNVTDIQFVSREDDMDLVSHHASSELTNSGIGFGSRKESEDLDSIPEVRHRKKHGTLGSSTTDNAHKRMGLTTSGEVEDVSKQGIYGCDAMVMLLGEEPEESLMDEEASLSMIMDGNDDEDSDGSNEEGNDDNNNDGRVNYNEIFATAEREYQRMQAHEELSTASYMGDVPIFDSSVTDIDAWLDGDDDEMEDEGATVVIGRAQFFMGAMREFIGMPASSAIDSKDRIMGGGVSAQQRRKGAVHRLAESWDIGDYGKKETDSRGRARG